VRDDQTQRYARHVILADIGDAGQTALLGACAKLQMGAAAEMVAASYLAAGGVGRLVVPGATPHELAELAAHGPDTAVAADPRSDGREVELPARPAWWPGAGGDALALAYWRGSIAATRWMVDGACRADRAL
jgi:hypothetical protein